MESLLKFLIENKRRQQICSNSGSSVSGFTMIELLVGTIIAFLIIAPMLGFVVNILNRDIKEQAKATTEREIQAAIEYISQDLSQAIYIYNPEEDGFEDFKTELPYNGDTDKTLSLVFWKRHLIREAICPSAYGDPISGCRDDEKDDAYVYSLVAYYLITDESEKWCQPPGEPCKRIGRVIIHDGVRDPNNFTQYIAEDDSEIGRSKGYNNFDIQKPLEWENAGDGFPSHDVLVNYMEGFELQQVQNNRLAKIQIVGNAKRRIPGNFQGIECKKDDEKDRKSPYCPRVSVQVRAGGSLGTEE